MIKKILIGLIVILAIGVLGFTLGPKPYYAPVNNIPSNKTFDVSLIDEFISTKESAITDIKEDNEARIVWADSTKQKTLYSIVYLHGFSASQGEGFPMHLNIGDSLNANLYLPRLVGHGIEDDNAMHDLSPMRLVEDAKQAIAIAKSIGEEVIVMGCSTGGTLAIYLAANDPSLAGLILLSPNIAINTPTAKMLTGPWGKEIAYKMVGSKRSTGDEYKQYWSNSYSTNGVIALQALIDQTMTKDVFAEIKMPVYCGYYYKNEDEQDPVVSVSAMLAFRDELTLPSDDMEFEAFPEAGDHVICSVYKNDKWMNVQEEVLDFIQREIVE